MPNLNKIFMRTRTEILTDLIEFNGSLDEVKAELANYPLEIEEPLVKITHGGLIKVLEKSIRHSQFSELVAWANFVELREDIDYESDLLKQLLFELSTPEINYPITGKRLTELCEELKNWRV